MAVRPITDEPDYTLCRDRGNPSDRGGIMNRYTSDTDPPGGCNRHLLSEQPCLRAEPRQVRERLSCRAAWVYWKKLLPSDRGAEHPRTISDEYDSSGIKQKSVPL